MAEVMEVAQENARTRAAQIVTRWLRSGDFPDRLIAPNDPDRAFVMEVVYGIARRRRTLEWVMKRCVEANPSPRIMAFLFVGLYQLLFMDTVTDYAAVNETVESVRSAHLKHAVGFVNGVLRRVVRERDDLRRMLAVEPIGIRESHPQLLVDRWTARYGAAATLALCRWNNTRPTVCITPRGAAGNLRTYLTQLWCKGVENAHPHSAEKTRCIELPHGVHVEDLPGYQEGAFMVQDPSTMMAVDLLNPQPGEHVLDACAAPGGKTVLIADRMQGRGVVIALETHADRVKRLQENILRCKIDHVLVAEGDATNPDLVTGLGKDRFNRILLDVPCTNTGVLRRRPDARWRFSLDRMQTLNKLQRAMLNNVVALLRPGGVIVYSTCSLEPEEGEHLVAQFIEQHRELKLEQTAMSLPFNSRMDGAFAALIRKI